MRSNKIIIGLLLGFAAGIIDVVPMIMMELPWDANISAFSMWIVVGFLVSVTGLKVPSILKGIVIAFCVMLPCAVLIAWKEPLTLLPVLGMTALLGGLLGWLFHKITGWAM